MSRRAQRQPPQTRSTFRITARGLRDFALFTGGLAGVAYETLGTHGERPTLLLLFAAMMGLPAFIRSDEARRK